MVASLGSAPNKFAKATARSMTVHAGALRTKRSPGLAFANAYSTNSTDSVNDIRNRVILGSVTVIGRPALTCSTKSGTTDPREYRTFPYRTIETVVDESGLLRANAW